MTFEHPPVPFSSEPPGPGTPRPPLWTRYLLAIVVVLLAWVARQGLTQIIGPSALPFIFFFPAVAIAAWWGGLGPGLVAIAFASFLANWTFVPPTWALSF